MIYWNHRLMRYANGTLGIHEVFYNDEDKTCTWAYDAADVTGVDIEEIREELANMLKAIDLPVLDHAAPQHKVPC